MINTIVQCICIFAQYFCQIANLPYVNSCGPKSADPKYSQFTFTLTGPALQRHKFGAITTIILWNHSSHSEEHSTSNNTLHKLVMNYVKLYSG